MKKNITFRMVAFTDAAGKYSPEAARNGNEDNFFFAYDLSKDSASKGEPDVDTTMSDSGLLMVVADGMGGMNAGEIASQIAVDTVAEFFAPGKINPELAREHQKRKKYLEHVICEADVRIKKDSKHDTGHKGMGSTIIMAWIVGDELTLSWCGDSRAYRYNPETGIELLSKDHSYVQELVDKGIIKYEDTFDHPQGNIVTRSLGDSAKATPDTKLFKVYNNDIILLCSDGLSGVLRDKKTYDMDGELIEGDNLEDIISAHRGSLKECREALWRAAEKADWYDNVTAVLCEIRSGAETYIPHKNDMSPVNQNTHDGLNNKTFKSWNINLTTRGLIFSFMGILFIIGATFLTAWLIFSKKQGADSKQTPTRGSVKVEQQAQLPIKNNDLSFVNAQVGLKLRITKIIESGLFKENDSIISNLKSSVDKANDRIALDEVKAKIVLLEQKIPFLTEISKKRKTTNNAKIKSSLNTLWDTIMYSDKIEKDKWNKTLKQIQESKPNIDTTKVRDNAHGNSELTEIRKIHTATIGDNDTYEGIISFLEKKYPGCYVSIIKDMDTKRTLFNRNTEKKVLISIKMAVGNQVEITLLPKNK